MIRNTRGRWLATCDACGVEANIQGPMPRQQFVDRLNKSPWSCFSTSRGKRNEIVVTICPDCQPEVLASLAQEPEQPAELTPEPESKPVKKRFLKS